MDQNVAIVAKENAHAFRKRLSYQKFEDKRWSTEKLSNGLIAIPIKNDFVTFCSTLPRNDEHYSLFNIEFRIDRLVLQANRRANTLSPINNLIQKLSGHFDFVLEEKFRRDLPRSWDKHGDLLLLPDNCFVLDEWKNIGSHVLWQEVASSFGCKRVARRGTIVSNDFRSPKVELVFGENSWVEHVDNKIRVRSSHKIMVEHTSDKISVLLGVGRYRYDITKSMFSSGNITEKLRVGKLDCTGETVVDLYAGIGYFTLPYLVHAKAAKVFACEWNPSAVEALKMNLELNGVNDRCTVLEGDNKHVCPEDVADRVNLGLIPSSEEGWPTACLALKVTSGGILHIHGNVTSHKRVDKNNESIDSVTTNEISSGTGIDLKRTNFVKTKRKEEWRVWADDVCRRLVEIFREHRGQQWDVEVVHVEHIKSYAPRIDHIVADVKCTPHVLNCIE